MKLAFAHIWDKKKQTQVLIRVCEVRQPGQSSQYVFDKKYIKLDVVKLMLI